VTPTSWWQHASCWNALGTAQCRRECVSACAGLWHSLIAASSEESSDRIKVSLMSEVKLVIVRCMPFCGASR